MLGGHDEHRGLSPPTRGNLRILVSSPASPRSIPAHAGEPIHASAMRHRLTVYPRPRGGTHPLLSVIPLYRGLSPPTRGNPLDYNVFNPLEGSIPAHAGEPTSESQPI